MAQTGSSCSCGQKWSSVMAALLAPSLTLAPSSGLTQLQLALQLPSAAGLRTLVTPFDFQVPDLSVSLWLEGFQIRRPWGPQTCVLRTTLKASLSPSW